MSNAPASEVDHPIKKLYKKLTGLLFWELSFAIDPVKKFLSLHQLSDKHEAFGCGDELKQFEEVGVIDSFQDGDLFLYPEGILFVGYFCFVEDFNCDCSAGGDVEGSPHFPEGSAPDGPLELQIGDFLHRICYSLNLYRISQSKYIGGRSVQHQNIALLVLSQLSQRFF